MQGKGSEEAMICRWRGPLALRPFWLRVWCWVCVLGALAGATLWHTQRAFERQSHLNDRLLLAVLQRDENGVEAALRAGADPRARMNERVWVLDSKRLGFTSREPTFVKRIGLFKDELVDSWQVFRGKKQRVHEQSALMYALDPFQGTTRITRLLLIYGADVNARGGPSDETALMVAAGHKDSAAVRLLVEAGADVNARDAEYGRTALRRIIYGRARIQPSSVAIARCLLRAGTDVNARDKQGLTLLGELRRFQTLSRREASWRTAIIQLARRAGAKE